MDRKLILKKKLIFRSQIGMAGVSTIDDADMSVSALASKSANATDDLRKSILPTSRSKSRSGDFIFDSAAPILETYLLDQVIFIRSLK
jgi:hypothetical protein